MYEYEYSRADKQICTKQGVLVAFDFNRIVYGDRGAYVEFLDEQIYHDAVQIPKEALWRLYGERGLSVYYLEYRTVDNVMVYYQKRRVDYADYTPSRWYISPRDLSGFTRKEK